MVKSGKMHISEIVRAFEQTCKENGLRITHQRVEVFRGLAGFPGHPTVENVFNLVRRRLKTISLDTVYRTIATFEDIGLIKRVQMLDNQARFDINLSVHHHLLCTRCKKIEDFYWPNFDRMKLPGSIKTWAKIDSRHAEIRGLCPECKRALKKK